MPEYYMPKFETDQQTFTRYMFAPELEEERAREYQRARIAENKPKFAWLDRGYGGMGGQELRLNVSMNTHMLGNMAGNMGQVKEYIWHTIERDLVNLFRAGR